MTIESTPFFQAFCTTSFDSDVAALPDVLFAAIVLPSTCDLESGHDDT